MASHNVITFQPQFSAAPRAGKWQPGLLDCCSDCGVCICGAFCFSCLGCQVAGDMDECCLCGPSMAMRTLYRTRYNVPGSTLDDWIAIMCCPMCSLCQLKRDINRRRELGIFWCRDPHCALQSHCGQESLLPWLLGNTPRVVCLDCG